MKVTRFITPVNLAVVAIHLLAVIGFGLAAYLH